MWTHARSLSRVWLFVTPRTVALQAPLFMGFPNKNTGVGCHFLLQGVFPAQGLNRHLLSLLLWQAGSLPVTTRKAWEGEMGFKYEASCVASELCHVRWERRRGAQG